MNCASASGKIIARAAAAAFGAALSVTAAPPAASQGKATDGIVHRPACLGNRVLPVLKSEWFSNAATPAPIGYGPPIR